jgi:type I restriction enzyme, S subunit
MKTYDSYKDSDVQWIGEIPEHWKIVKIKYMPSNKPLSFIDGDWIESKDIIFDEGIRYITTGNIGEGKYKEQGSSFISEETFSELNCTEVFPGDLLISRLNKPIGRSCIVPDLGNRIVTSVDNVIFRPKEKYLKSYLNFLMNNPKYSDYTELIARGATMQRISRGLLAEIKLPVPPLFEQIAIANYLDLKTTEIDQIITDKEALINLYEEEKKALVNEAVTKGVTLSEVETCSPKLKPSGVDWLGDIPEHWEVKKLKYVGDFVNGYAFDSNEFCDYGIRVVKISNIQHMEMDWSDESFVSERYFELLPNFRLNKGDLVFALTRPIISTGIKAAIINTEEKLLINQRNAVLKPKMNVINGWLYNILLTQGFIETFDRQIDKSGQQPNISSEKIGNIGIPVPPIFEQTAIVRHIETETTKINDKINLIKQEIELLKEYRQALIFEAVTGKIRVH